MPIADDYWKRHYSMSAQDTCDELTLSKTSGSDWSHITMITNGDRNGEITIRSRFQAEQLHLMLKQMLAL